MLNKHFFILLALIIVIGFSFGFFTSGKSDREAAVESGETATLVQSAPADASDLVPIAAAADGQDAYVYRLMMLSAAQSGHNFEVSKALVDVLGDMKYDTAVTITGSTQQNIAGLLDGQGQLAVSNSDTAREAYNAKGAFSELPEAKNLRVLMSMWVNYGQLLVRADSNIHSLADLSGKIIAVDEPDSDADRAIRALLNTTEMPFSKDSLGYMALPEALNELEQGVCDAIFLVGMLESDRAAMVQESGFGIRPIPIDDEAFERLLQFYPYYMRNALPAETFGSASEIPTIATVNVMLVSENVPEEVVYTMLKDLFAQKDVFGEKYPILQKALFDEDVALDIGVPFHAGAQKYYREYGMME